MPTYQYACTACGEQLEAVQAFSDAPLTECPACAGRLRKVFSAVGVVFKGSGFYKTDSRANGKSGNAAAKESSPSSSKDGGKDGGQDSAGGSTPAAAGTSSSSTSSSSSSSASTPA